MRDARKAHGDFRVGCRPRVSRCRCSFRKLANAVCRARACRVGRGRRTCRIVVVPQPADALCAACASLPVRAVCSSDAFDSAGGGAFQAPGAWSGDVCRHGLFAGDGNHVPDGRFHYGHVRVGVSPQGRRRRIASLGGSSDSVGTSGLRLLRRTGDNGDLRASTFKRFVLCAPEPTGDGQGNEKECA